MKSRTKQIRLAAVVLLLALMVSSCATPVGKSAYVGEWRKGAPQSGLMTITDAGDHLAVVEDGRELEGRMERNGDLRVTGATLVLPVTMSYDRATGHLFVGNSEYQRTRR